MEHDQDPRQSAEGGAGSQQPSQPSQPAGSGEATGASPSRRFGASRLRPRVEFGAPRPPASATRPDEQPDVLTGEVIDEDELYGRSGSAGGRGGAGTDPFGSTNPFGTPREFAGGRVRVYGCSPGCLLTSLLVSIFLTLLLNTIL